MRVDLGGCNILVTKHLLNTSQVSYSSSHGGQYGAISDLIDFVEDELYDNECNHSLQYSMRFMMDNRLDFPKLTSWLNENGGYCDCEVMKQIAPKWRAKFGDD